METIAADAAARPLPPVLSRLLRGTFWLALRTPMQAVIVFWSVPLIVGTIGDDLYGAYGFAWGFGFLQFVLEFGMSSALQRQVSEAYTKGDRDGVNRAIACGMCFYAAMAFVQAAALLGVAYLWVPRTDFQGDSVRLIVRLLWLQALTAPCFGISTVVTCVLQAARRFEFIPRLEFAIVVIRFLILVAGLKSGVDFFWIVAAQTAAHILLSMGPALWVMVRELGYVPHFQGARWGDYRALMHISFYMFLIQLSVVLADKIDTTVLGTALHDPGPAVATYQVISKPFLQLRQAGWMLAFMVMPAVASLAAAHDEAGLERVKYDGPRFLIGLLLPVALLAWIDAGSFLAVWVPKFAKDAYLMRLFLVAAIPIVLSVHVQMAIGMNKISVIALAALAGSVINLPLSYALTLRLGVSGVIWGTVLTTLFSNLLVPGIYVFRVLDVRPATFFRRTLGPPLVGALALIAVAAAARPIVALPLGETDRLARALPLVAHLGMGCLAYLAGYLAMPTGRGDLAELRGKLRARLRPEDRGLSADGVNGRG